MISIAIIGVIVAFLIVSSTIKSNQIQCESARTFEQFYGLSSLINNDPFRTLIGETRNLKDPFFQAALPQGLLQFDSFVLHAKRGSGKTVVRKLITDQLVNSDKYFLVPLLNAEVQTFLDPFFQNGYSMFIWSKNDFMDLVLASAVTSFIQSFYPTHSEQSRAAMAALPLTTKLEIIGITCMYYHDATSWVKPLEKFVNELLGLKSHWIRKGNWIYSSSVQVETWWSGEFPEYMEISSDYTNVRIRRPENKNGLKLLYEVLKRAGKPFASLTRDRENSVRTFASFMQRVYGRQMT